MLLYYILFIFPAIAGVSALLYLPFYLRYRKKYGKRPFLRHLVLYGLIGVLLSLLYITIGFYFSLNPSYHLLNLTPFIWLKKTYTMGFAKMLEQLMMNVLMLIPLGFLLPLAAPKFRKAWKTVLFVALLILVLETTQYFIGRSADIDDLIMNTLGGWLGYSLYALGHRLWKDKPFWHKAAGLEDRYREDV